VSDRKRLDYALRKDLSTFGGNRIAVRFQYEWRDRSDQWHRWYGNEHWEFDDLGFMRRREASINDRAITAADRRIHGSRTGGDTAGLPLR
jgi:nuclear transport factor 2 (NTF2) superfamily protein